MSNEIQLLRVLCRHLESTGTLKDMPLEVMDWWRLNKNLKSIDTSRTPIYDVWNQTAFGENKIGSFRTYLEARKCADESAGNNVVWTSELK